MKKLLLILLASIFSACVVCAPTPLLADDADTSAADDTGAADDSEKKSDDSDASAPEDDKKSDDEKKDDDSDASPLQKQIEAILIKNPEILEKAFKALHKKKESGLRKAQSKLVKENLSLIYDDKNYPVLGNPSAPYTIVGFFDHQCGFCHVMLSDLNQYVKANPDFRIIIRDNPFLSDISQQLAELSIIAFWNGKFQPYLDAVLAIKGPIDAKVIDKLKSTLGLDKSLSAAETQKLKSTIEATKNLTHTLSIESAPSFIVKHHVYATYKGLEKFDKLITKKLRNKKDKGSKDNTPKPDDADVAKASVEATPVLGTVPAPMPQQQVASYSVPTAFVPTSVPSTLPSSER